MAPPNTEAIHSASDRGVDFANHMGWDRTAQRLYDDLSKQPDAALRQAELAGATAELAKLGVLPNMEIEKHNAHGHTDYQVVDTTSDHQDLVIAAGDKQHPHYVVMDNAGHFYNAVLDREHPDPDHQVWKKGDSLAANAAELDKKEGRMDPREESKNFRNGFVERDGNNLPIHVKDVWGNEWRVQRAADGTPGDIVTTKGNEVHCFAKNYGSDGKPDGTYTVNGKPCWVTIEGDGTFSCTMLKNSAAPGSPPDYRPEYNNKWTPQGDSMGDYSVDNRHIHWEKGPWSYGVVDSFDITTNGKPTHYQLAKGSTSTDPFCQYKSSDPDDHSLYRFNRKLGRMLPVH